MTTSYAYGPDGSRVRKVSGGQATLYLGADVEIRPRAMQMTPHDMLPTPRAWTGRS